MHIKRARTVATLLLSLTAATAFTVALLAPNRVGAAHAERRPTKKKHLLVVTVTMGFPHDSRPTAEQVIAQLGQDTGEWDTDICSADSKLSPAQKADILKAKMTGEALKRYDAVVFANTTGELPLPDFPAFLDYIESGHGFVAMHSGSDTFHNWPPAPNVQPSAYVEMLGAEFAGHNRQTQIAGIINDSGFPANKRLLETAKRVQNQTGKTDAKGGSFVTKDKRWNVFDEIYLFKNVDRKNLHVLLSLNKHPDDGSKEANQPGEYLVSWTKAYGKGRVFYTSLGHRIEVWKDPLYQQYIIGGIEFALKIKGGSTGYTAPPKE